MARRVSRRPIDDAGTSGRRHRCQCDQCTSRHTQQDVRYALRSLARTPGFTATAIVVAGLGIGATTATFSTADHVLLRPLPFADPERLVRLSEDRTPLGYPRIEPSPPNYSDWKRMQTSFESIEAFNADSDRRRTGEPSGSSDRASLVACSGSLGVLPRSAAH